ncbi:APC family permease [Rouxiella badensis]|uniref:APC family permease n=1 Tax=Rouxiella badensis TaxID=1646377 RepID=UPI0022AAFE5B|nr:APC family permease [Rouxiella badensis]WAT09670.1 APC family permease [Rouxiella badensis]
MSEEVSSSLESTAALNSTVDQGHKQLTGRISLLELLSTVLAYSAPIAVVSGFIPFVIVFNGIGAPLIFVATMILMLVFAVGFTKMTQYIVNPGAFYAYITAGLGKVPGLGAAFLAIYGYLLLTFCTMPFLGINFRDLVHNTFYGPEIPWYFYALLCWAACSVLSFLKIELSTKVLTTAMILEVLIVVIFNISVISHGGAQGFNTEPFTWKAFTSGSVGLALLFAVTVFIGFEATAVFRDEVKDPVKTVPRAAYLAVLFIGLFYALAAWILITAFGDNAAVEYANKSPADMFSVAMLRYVGQMGVDVTRVLLVTSLFASMLSGWNIVARYLYTLSKDGVLPKSISAVHQKHNSPYIASIFVSALTLILVLAFILIKSDPVVIYGQVAGVGGFAIMLLMFITSVSVFFFFIRSSIKSVSKFKSVVAPVVSSIGLLIILYLAISHFDLLIGGGKMQAIILECITFGVFILGSAVALYNKNRRPDVYRRIGGNRI